MEATFKQTDFNFHADDGGVKGVQLLEKSGAVAVELWDSHGNRLDVFLSLEQARNLIDQLADTVPPVTIYQPTDEGEADAPEVVL